MSKEITRKLDFVFTSDLPDENGDIWILFQDPDTLKEFQYNSRTHELRSYPIPTLTYWQRFVRWWRSL